MGRRAYYCDYCGFRTGSRRRTALRFLIWWRSPMTTLTEDA